MVRPKPDQSDRLLRLWLCQHVHFILLFTTLICIEIVISVTQLCAVYKKGTKFFIFCIYSLVACPQSSFTVCRIEAVDSVEVNRSLFPTLVSASTIIKWFKHCTYFSCHSASAPHTCILIYCKWPKVICGVDLGRGRTLWKWNSSRCLHEYKWSKLEVVLTWKNIMKVKQLRCLHNIAFTACRHQLLLVMCQSAHCSSLL